ncbi:MAG: patatin family protein [Hominenteromicrobium sp.]
MKTGIIDVGGGLRGIYAAGVFDRCLEMGVSFDVCIGVSAGSANICSFLAGQKKRNYAFYTEYPFRKEYMSLRNFLFKHTYIDLDYVYSTLSNAGGENPLDYPAFSRSTAEALIVASNANTGAVKYFTKADIGQDNYDILKASSAIPFVCKPYAVGNDLYYDGALGDPVPVEKAFALGCDRVIVILSKPRDTRRTPEKDVRLADRIQRKYPLAAKNLRLRAQRYNEGVARAKRYEAQGRALIVAPESTCGVDTLTKKREAMQQLYELGLRDAEAIPAFLS